MDGSTIVAPEKPARPAIFDRLSALADPIRCRALLLLERHELSVSELCAVLQLPQSTVSRHLKVLAADGWVAARQDGTSRRYAATLDSGSGRSRLWELVGGEVGAGVAAAADDRRLREILSRRRTRSQEYFSSTADQWAEVRKELYGERFDLLALLGLLDDRWTVGDLGAGNGLLARSLASFVERVIAVDDSPAMLEAARRRLEDLDNVELRRGRLEQLPVADGELDAATLLLVLHHTSSPGEVLGEAARALKPGGRLLIVDMLAHDREELRREMGHVWLGFEEEGIRSWLADAGFEPARFRPLPPDPAAKGPTLFAASANKPKR